MTVPEASLQLRSTIKSSGELELSLVDTPVPAPEPDQVVVRIEAAPINPSDIGLLFGAADVAAARASGTAERPILTAPLSPAALRAAGGRLDQSLPAGSEGAGVVVAAGAGPEAQALLGKTVAILGGAMYAEHRVVKAADCLLLPAGATPADGASCFVNPLTALGMVETMRREGHTAIVHTAAASNLGQMLAKICLSEGIGLVNIVRTPEQAAALRGIGSPHVCDTSAPGFLDDLGEALAATAATIAFDAVGGGKLASQILTGMEAAATRNAGAYSRYGSSVFKQVYIYGGLDTSPTVLNRSFGLSWSLGGWLLTPFLAKIGRAETDRLKARVAAELTTTFASRYAAEVSLAEALKPEVAATYTRRATGEKYLINPAR